jgi:hypothetical protein
MLRARFLSSVLIPGLAIFMAACGGVNSTPPSTGVTGVTHVSLSLRDAPPAGVTVLSFEITVNSAILQPGNVALVNAPIKVEVEHLQTESAFLSTISAPAGAYSSIAVTFANPELTIKNNSGAAIGSCANGAVCELTPPLNPATVTFSGSPFPLNLSSSTPTGLLLDFNLNNSIQTDLSINPTVTFSQFTEAQEGSQSTEGENENQHGEFDETSGKVTNIDAANNQFTITTSHDQPLTIKVDSNTKFENFENMGLANTFASLAVGQIVSADVELMSGGTLLAKEVQLEDQSNENDLEGTIVSVDSPTQFHMVVLDEEPPIAGVAVGNPVTVTIQTGASFLVHNHEEGGASIPTNASFSSSADLMVGQEVEIRSLTGSARTTIVTDRVVLRPSHISAKVESVSGGNFIVNNLSSLFTGATPSVTEIQVLVSSETKFEHVSGVAGLSVGDSVALRGLLFKTTALPELVAEKVRKL